MVHLRRCLAAAVCAFALCATCPGQTPFTTSIKTSAAGPAPAHIYAVDVNNDGLTDIVQDNASGPAEFTVSISNGDGTFKAPVTYKLGSSASGPAPIASGDFNGDGKDDLAFALPGTSQVAVYFGNGDGTFEGPTTTILNLPAGFALAATPMVAADFNHDGHLDLVLAGHNSSGGGWSIYLLPGNGYGAFENAVNIYNPTSGWSVRNIVAGDFDTDNNADVTVLETIPCSGSSAVCYSNVLTLFGNGDNSFDPVDVTTVSGFMNIGSGSVNEDAATDLFGIEQQSGQLAIFTGNYDRRFSYYYYPVSLGNVTLSDSIAPGDFLFNGGVGFVMYASSGSQSNVLFVLPSTTSSGYQTILKQVANEPVAAGPVIGNFNGDMKQDVAISQSSSATASSSTLSALLNTIAGGELDGYSLCNYPAAGQAIRLCSPSAATTPGTAVKASANSFGQIRKIEFWLDGVKRAEGYEAWGSRAFLFSGLENVAAGTHHGTIYAVNIDNSNQRLDFDVTVGSACGPPPQNAYGVNVCTPQSLDTYGSPLQVEATAKIAGTLARMEIWVDGVKEYTETTSTSINTSVPMGVGSGYGSEHEVDVYAVNTAGTKYESSVIVNYH